jgi:hypothetical protein
MKRSAAKVAVAIPESEMYAMMGIGLGFVGWAARRRRQQAA